jgi:uncharacterized coiled-coil protein SlyX
MSEYPQEVIDTLRNMVAAQKERIAQLQAQADDMYTAGVFYKAQLEAVMAEIKVLKGEG